MNKIMLMVIVYLGIIDSTKAQDKISNDSFKPYTIHFSLTDDHRIVGEARNVLLDKIADNQFVGVAEVHQSRQLSFFTTGLLELLKEKRFEYFALEVGPHSAQVLQELSGKPETTAANINALNKKYGRNSFPKIPIVFADKVEDAFFIEKASELGFTFWGLDQEFSYSYGMHLDRIYNLAREKTAKLDLLYKKSKALIRKNIFRKKISGVSKNCWLMNEPTLQEFFVMFKNNDEAEAIIYDMQKSWDIYCSNESGKAANQLRANYMKDNFDSLYSLAFDKDTLPKVLAKLGGVHLTRGVSVFRVKDIGMHLAQKAEENQTGFLSIRHLTRYRKGKDLTGKKGWQGVELFMQQGLKDKWTLIDLRPLRQKVQSGELEADTRITFELQSYDLLLIPPDDKKSKLNY